ncbi:MAG TPA: hypothetical protein VMZ30_22735 [Pyrinomonadaceae bacterium]|nr:hypothetical protein [Pyrinomonadaceae bacterium]
MNELIGQQSNWDPEADEAARRRIKEQQVAEQQKPDPEEEEEARRRIEEQRRQEEQRNKQEHQDDCHGSKTDLRSVSATNTSTRETHVSI